MGSGGAGHMPRSKAEAMTQTELFIVAGGISGTTGRKALAEMLAAGAIERIGAGGSASLTATGGIEDDV
jgi:hypothetical protein